MVKESSSDEEEDVAKASDEEIVLKVPDDPALLISKRIDPNDFVQAAIKEISDIEDSLDEDDDEERNAFTADVTTFDSGIE